MNQNRYEWARAGDVNAFFGLMLDNIAGLVLMVGMLAGIFGFPVDFALSYMVPGTAIGVLVGDLLYTWLAFAHAKKTGNTKVTAMPLGLDTPSTIGMVLFVLGPSYVAGLNAGLDETAAAMQTWHIGICAIFLSGLLKFALAFCSDWIRRVLPRAGLLGSLAAIALVLITFHPLEVVSENPLVGFAALILVFLTLVGRGKLPFQIPGALGAVMAGCVIWYLMVGMESLEWITLEHKAEIDPIWIPQEWLTVFSFEWFGAMEATVPYLPYIFPFAIATVIGGIDCAESAASVGDDFNTNTVIGIEAFATLVASVCGGVIQSTPYIGHPAYKAMGGRAGYTLATALFIGGAGLIGYFGLLFKFIPPAAVMPILIFIGIEITAQSFHVTPKRHYAAIAVACLPALAKLIVIYLDQYVDRETMASNAGILNLQVLAGGFIITSLIWASALARIVDRKFVSASIYLAVGGILVLFGVMHSPNNDQMFWPTQIASFTPEARKIVIEYAMAYLVMALLVYGYGFLMKDQYTIIETDEAFEKLGE